MIRYWFSDLRRSMLMGAAAAAGLLLGAALSAQTSARFDHLVRNDFFAGFNGNPAALERAMKKTEAVLAENPKHAEALVWHGAGLFAQAGAAFQSADPQKGGELLKRGLSEMDQAVALAPDTVGVRIPRGAVLLAATRGMPENPMKKGLLETGLGDYQHVFELQKNHLDKLGEHPRGELLFGLAEGYSRAGKRDLATEYFDRLLRDMPQTEWGKRAAIWKEKGSLEPHQTTCYGCHAGK